MKQKFDVDGTKVKKANTAFYLSGLENAVAGFITSHNLLNRKLHAKNITYNMSQKWLESFCYKNPNIIFERAVKKFIFEFTK